MPQAGAFLRVFVARIKIFFGVAAFVFFFVLLTAVLGAHFAQRP